MISFGLQITGEQRIIDWAERLPRDFAGRAARLLTAYAFDVEREAKMAAAVATGLLRSSIHTRIEHKGDRTVAYIGTNLNYAPYVEFGTGVFGPRRERIRPTSKKALSWIPRRGMPANLAGLKRLGTRTPQGRTRIFARSVLGMRPRPYLGPAIERVRPAFLRDIHKLADLMFPRV